MAILPRQEGQAGRPSTYSRAHCRGMVTASRPGMACCLPAWLASDTVRTAATATSNQRRQRKR